MLEDVEKRRSEELAVKKNVAGRMEWWKSGGVKGWRSGRMEEWKDGGVEEWRS